jgi:PIN domain nuclease of toxin-antitoxin system
MRCDDCPGYPYLGVVVDENPQLSERHTQLIQANEHSGLGISAISCWEVAKLVEYGRLRLDGSIAAWMEQAFSDSRVLG